MNTNIYEPFPRYILRIPLLPIRYFLDLTKGQDIDIQKVKEIFEKPEVQEAIFLASPDFYELVLKHFKSSDYNDDIIISLLKYFSRMSSRCTPFGLFAGCTFGRIGNSTSLQVGDRTLNNRETKLDMFFLYPLGKEISKIKEIKNQLKFYPNETIYESGDQLRYVETHFNNDKKTHSLASVILSDVLLKILENAQNGKTLSLLAKDIVCEDISYEEALNFTNELVDNNILISELEPSASGDNYLNQILEVIKEMDSTENIVSEINNIQNELKILDKKIGNPIKKYTNLKNRLEAFNIPINRKYLFQCDMETLMEKNTVSTKICYQVLEGLSVQSAFQLKYSNPTYEKFKDDFINRYGDEEIQLIKALDSEKGVGYDYDVSNLITPKLLKDIHISRKNIHQKQKTALNEFQIYIFNTILKESSNNNKVIQLDQNKVEKYREKLTNLPVAFSTLIRIIENKSLQKIEIMGLDGSSAANILSRFCYLNQEIEEHVKEIIEIEKPQSNNVVNAEVLHFPDSRIGNIIMKPVLRDYEITYLSNSNFKGSRKLEINDLFISIDMNRNIIIRSKKLNKIVSPYITSAHNYGGNVLNIYKFLGDHQHRNKKSIIHPNIPSIFKDLQFVPRIEYKNIILSRATWNIKKADIVPLVKALNYDNEKFQNTINRFVEDFKILDLVVLVDGDNKLLVNMKNIVCVKMLIKTVKHRNFFILKEFLHDEKNINTSEQDIYSNEIVLSYKKKLQHASN